MLLLARDAPRSEHDPDPCPDLEAAAANIAMHPFTGAFADASHETAFTAHLFRMAFPCHVSLMALILPLIGWTAFLTPLDLWPFLSVLAFCITLGLVGRVLVHRMDDTVRGQRLGSWTWTATVVLVVAIDVVAYVEHVAQACGPVALHNEWIIQAVAGSLVNGSHGLGFGHKLGLIGLMLLDGLYAIALCGEVALACESLLGVGFVVAHLVEMHLRHSYVEKQRQAEDKRRLEERMDKESRRLEERNEQLRAEKERLLYDNELQRRGRPLDDGDDRSAIRRGLQGKPSQQPPTSDGDTTSSDRSGVKPPPDSAPPSLPPGPPSSTSSGSTAPPLYIWAKPTAPPPTAVELVARHVEQEVAHALLFCARGQTSHQCQSAGVAGAACSGVAATAIVPSAASDGVPTPEQALLIARRDILIAEDQIHVHRVIRTLGLALGATRMEAGTIRALHAVLLQQARPGMNDMEAYRSTGASRSNFSKWRRRVQHILSEGAGSAALAPPPRVSPRCFDS